MGQISLLAASFVFSLLFFIANAETEEATIGLVQFMKNLSPGAYNRGPNFGWNMTSDPCANKWSGVFCGDCSEINQGEFCRNETDSVIAVVLNRLGATGTIDAVSLCKATNLVFFSLNNNEVKGVLPNEISNCRNLNYLLVRNNSLTGSLPAELSNVTNLKSISLSNNNLTGEIPNYKFYNLVEFNISNNNLVGEIPDGFAHFGAGSFLGNPGLCGYPLPNACT